MSSTSSSASSLRENRRHRKKARSKKLDEVERLAEMERQRRQKEAEQKVSPVPYYIEFRKHFIPHCYVCQVSTCRRRRECSLFIFYPSAREVRTVDRNRL